MYSEIEKSADIIISVLMTPEMKTHETIRLQNIKNRNGAVVLEPVDLKIDLPHGWTISELEAVSLADACEGMGMGNRS